MKIGISSKHVCLLQKDSMAFIYHVEQQEKLSSCPAMALIIDCNNANDGQSPAAKACAD